MAQLGTWQSDAADDDYQDAWDSHFAIEHDPTGLFCEANLFRYRPLERMGLRVGKDANESDLALVRKAAKICGVKLIESFEKDQSDESFCNALPELGVERVRLVGTRPSETLLSAANLANVYVADEEVSPIGRIELQRYVREQAISQTLHRFGNLVL